MFIKLSFFKYWLYLLIMNPTPTYARKAEFVHFYMILCKVSNAQRSFWMWKISYNSKYRSKYKVIPVTGRGGSQVYETSRLVHCLDNRLTDGGEVVYSAWTCLIYLQIQMCDVKVQ
jgi:hypothetical protein